MSFLQNLFSRRRHRRQAGGEPAVAVAAALGGSAPANPADCVCFSLKDITDLFPPDLTAALRKHPSEHVQVHIPRDLIRHQLAAGAVRITFDQLRAATPEVFFRAEGAPAGTKLLLPLETILAQVTAPRREDQRQPSIPINIPSVFLKAAPPGAIAGAAQTTQDSWYSQRRPSYETQPESEPGPRKVDKPDKTPPPPPNGNKPYHPLNSITNRPRRSEPGAAHPAAPVTASPDSFALPLSAVLPGLPEEVRHALNGSDARTANFVFPLGEFNARMRTGKLLFKWAQLRDWCSVALGSPIDPTRDIELPLAVVVPLFMAAHGPAAPRPQVEVDTRIPDIFSKSKFASRVHPATPVPPAPAAVAHKPAPMPPSPPLTPARPAEPSPASVPAQVVAHLRKIEGVAGAFIATADGLLVAGDVPDSNEDVLAAFAPTVFAQLTKYSDMALLGLPESIDIHLGGGATVHVRKAGRLYLGVLVPPGRALPHQELTRLSNALQPVTT